VCVCVCVMRRGACRRRRRPVNYTSVGADRQLLTRRTRARWSFEFRANRRNNCCTIAGTDAKKYRIQIH